MGINKIKLNDDIINIKITGQPGFNLYNITRIIQILSGSLILGLGGYTYNSIQNLKINKNPLLILLFFGLNSLSNGLTSTCSISNILKDKLN